MAQSIYGDDEPFQRPTLPTTSTPPPNAPPAPPRSIYDDDDPQLLGAIVRQGAEGSPSTAARVLAVQQKTGLPTPVIERNLDDLEKQMRAANFNPQQLRENYPALAAWLKEEPQRAALAQDDLNHLSLLDWLTTMPQRAVSGAMNRQAYSKLRYREQFGPGLSQEERDAMGTYKFAAERDARLGDQYSRFRRILSGFQSFWAQQLPIAEATLQGAGYGATAGLGATAAMLTAGVVGSGAVASAVAGIPIVGMAAAGAGVGAMYGLLRSTHEQEFADKFDEYSALRDESGRPLDPNVAKWAAFWVSIPNALIEAGAQEVLLRNSPLAKLSIGGFTGAVDEAVKRALIRPTVRAALQSAATGYAATITAETGQEVWQQLNGIMAREVAVSLSNRMTGGDVAHADAAAIERELLDTFTGAMESFALAVLPGPASLALRDLHRARVGERNAAFFEALGEGVAGSKTHHAFAPALQSFIERATKNGPIDDTFIPLEPFTQYWQSKGVDPAQMATELTGDPQAFDNAVKTGEDLRVKTAVYASRIAPTEHNEFFARELRLGSPDAMNGREAAAIIDAEAARAKEDRELIQEDLARKLEAAGTPGFAARPQGQLLGSIFSQLFQRRGSPQDRYLTIDVDVTREGINDEATRAAAAEGLERPADAAPDIPPSIGNERETRSQALARRQAHMNAMVSVIVRDAQRLDPNVDIDQIRNQVERRFDMHHEAAGASLEAGGGQDLLRAIARLGGVRLPAPGEMFHGEVYDYAVEGRDPVTRSGRVRGRGAATWNGVPGVFGDSGDTLDGMVVRLREEGIIVDDINALLDLIGGSLRATPTTVDMLPGTAELGELGIKLGTRWWEGRAGRRADVVGEGRASVDADGYTQTLAGQPLVQSDEVLREGDEPGRPRGAGVTGRDGARSEDRTTDSGESARSAGDDRVATATELVTRYERPLGSSSVISPADAARATAYLARGAQERFDALVTDEHGTPLAVVGSFKGAVAEAHVHAGVLVAEAFRVPGAANIWFSHNHPSGVAALSTADQTLWIRLSEMFRGTAITARGLLAVGAESDAEHAWEVVVPGGRMDRGAIRADSIRPGMVVPVLERELVRTGTLSEPLTPKTAATAIATLARGEFGVVLTDSKLRAIAFIPIDIAHAAHLRTEGRLDALYRGLSETAAALSFIYVPDITAPGAVRASENLADALLATEVPPIDIVQTEFGGRVTLASQRGFKLSGQFFQKGVNRFALTHAPMRSVGGLLRVSTRVPEGQHATERHDVLTTRLEALDEDEARDAKERYAMVARESDLLTTEEKRRLRNADDAALELFVRRGVSNLRWLWNQLRDEDRERARHWYVGGHRIAARIASAAGVTHRQGAALLAVLSPQQDWFANVALAQRAANIYRTAERTNPTFTPEMFARYAQRELARFEGDGQQRIRRRMRKAGASERAINAEIALGLERQRDELEAAQIEMVGVQWADLDVPSQAVMLREIDEAAPRSFNIILPEGDEDGPVMAPYRNREARLGWGTYGQIEDAINVLRHGADDEQLQQLLGLGHKVRSFFDNLSDPSWDQAVTIDTHAVAAVYLKPFSGQDREARDTMGGRPKALGAGLRGFNPVIAEAYFRMAEQLTRELGRRVLPREVQSVTWEAVRLLFPAEEKGTADDAGEAVASALQRNVNKLWKLHARGTLTANAVRSRVAAAAGRAAAQGGIGRPAWAHTPSRLAAVEGVLRPRDVLAIDSVVPARRGGAESDPRRPAGAGAELADGVIRGVGSPATRVREVTPTYGDELAPEHVRALELYRERGHLASGGSTVGMAAALRDAMREAGATPASIRAAVTHARVRELLDVAHGAQSYGQPMPGFYSRLTRAVEASTTQRASGRQWKATIRNAKAGVNADEFALAGVGDLDDATQYTRGEVLAYLAANELVVVPTVFSGQGFTDRDVDDLAEQLMDEERASLIEDLLDNDRGPTLLDGVLGARYDEDQGQWEPLIDGEAQAGWYDTEAEALEQAEAIQAHYNDLAQADWEAEVTEGISDDAAHREAYNRLVEEHGGTAPQFESYVMAGPAHDYQEVMLAVPGLYNLRFKDAARRFYGKPVEELTIDEQTQLTARMNGWRDGHSEYDAIENPIVRLRFNTRQAGTKDVARVVEPLPSGRWAVRIEGEPTHQQSFATREEAEAAVAAFPTVAMPQWVLFLEEVQPPGSKEYLDTAPPLFHRHWRDIALKWALQHAVEEELDVVAWTPGDVQADRYSLARVLSRLEYYPKRNLLIGLDHGGREVWHQEETTPPELEKLVGKDVAARLLETEPKVLHGARGTVRGNDAIGYTIRDFMTGEHVVFTDAADGARLVPRVYPTREEAEEAADKMAIEGHALTGLELHVGGEGLRQLYDVDLVNTMKRLAVVKKGGGQMTTVPIVKEVLSMPTPAHYVGSAVRAWQEMHPDTPVTIDAPAIAITPEMRAQIEQGQPLFQGDKDERGFVRFYRRDGRLAKIHIGMLRNADLSTFVHEVGHVAFELMGDLAEELQETPAEQLTPEQRGLVNDYWNLVKAAAAATDTTITTRAEIGEAQHEWVARAWEAYIREGNAPSVELRSAFSRLSAWLLSIYRTVRSLGVQLDPEVRGIFDRILASNAAIAEAEQDAVIAPLFTDAKSAGMTELAYAEYLDQVRQASARKQEQLRQRVLNEFQREKTAWWRDEHDTIYAAVERELQREPVFRAVSILRTGLNPDGTLPDGTEPVEGQEPNQVKLSRESLVAQFGRAILKRLPRGVYAADSGVSADTAAALLRDVGVPFNSGDDLVRALAAARPLRVVAEEETQNRLIAKHGDVMRGHGLQAAAQRVVEGEHQAEVVQAELEALTQGMVANTIPSAETINHMAERRIAETPIRDVRPGVYLQAARRASKRAFDLLAKGNDRAGAVNAKLQELVNLALYRHARDAQERVEVMRRRLQDYRTPAARQRFGRAGGTHLAQIDALLDRFELARVTQKDLRRRASLAEYVHRQQQANEQIDIDPQLLDESRRRNYLDMTYGEFVGVHDAIEQIANIARLKNKLLKASRQRTFEEARDELAASIIDNGTPKALPLEFRQSDEKYRRIGDAFASLMKMGMLARAIDGHQDGGLFWEYITRPMNEAADQEQVRKAAAGLRLRDLFALYKGADRRALDAVTVVPGTTFSLSKEARLMVALNWGNEDNRQRLLADPTRRWTLGDVQAILNTLDERDWRFVQGVWDYVDSFWPEIAEKQQRVTGLAPEKVSASPVETKFGTLRGGYFPLVYDGRMVARADAFQVANDAELRMKAGFVSQATTRRGHTKMRQQNVKLSIRLEFGVIAQHTEQVIHDLTHHEMLLDVGRLLGDHDVQAAIYATRGDIVYRQFTAGLRDVALGSTGPAAQHLWDHGANWLKSRSQLALLGLNFWTAVQQPLGIFNSMQRVGPVWVLKGMKRFLRDAASMESTGKWIYSVSAMMRHRGDTATQDLADLRGHLATPGGWFDELTRTVTRDRFTQQDVVDAFTWHIGFAQRFADFSAFLGAYEKAAADPANYVDGNLDEKRVVALADQAVIDSQGSGSVKDLAQAQRGNAWAKLFLMFYSYGSTVFNSTSDAVGQFRRTGSVGTFVGHLSLLYILPTLGTVAFATAMGRRGGGDDDEGWFTAMAREVLATAMNTMPLVREAGGAVMVALGFEAGARGYEGPAGTRPFSLLYQLAQQVQQGDVDRAAVRAATQVAGVLFRFPAAQAQRTIDGYVALEEGRTNNPFALLVGAPRGGR